jgi:hypothetical protein
LKIQGGDMAGQTFDRVHGIPTAEEYRASKNANKESTVQYIPPTFAPAPNRASTLPIDAAARKKFPIATGVLDYFPDALLAVAEVSYVGNEQHNPGQPLHWDRSKSKDQADTAIRHFMERGKRDTDGTRHLAKAAWRILAALQLEIEDEIYAKPGQIIDVHP